MEINLVGTSYNNFFFFCKIAKIDRAMQIFNATLRSTLAQYSPLCMTHLLFKGSETPGSIFR